MSYLENLKNEGRLIGRINLDLINVKDYILSQNKTTAVVYYDNIKLKKREINQEVDSTELLEIVRSEFYKEVKDFVEEYVKAGNESPILIEELKPKEITEEQKQEINELTKDALPMNASPDLKQILHNKGFVPGSVLSLESGGFGVFTGIFKDIGEDGVTLEMTDGSTYNSIYCTIITDVNKQILRTVYAEKGRVKEQADNFNYNVEQFMNKLIYGKD